MSKNDIRDLAKRGHQIGSHSHTHPNVFRNQSIDQMRYEWSTSKNILEDILGEEVLICSVPGGDVDDNT